jgi:hypothetical protein
MPKATLSDIRSTIQPLTTYHWDVLIPQIPGGGDSVALSARAQSSTIPSKTADIITTRFKDVEIRNPGIKHYSESITLTFGETLDMKVAKAMRAWYELCSAFDSNRQQHTVGAAGGTNPKTNIILNWLDGQTYAPVWELNCFGVWMRTYTAPRTFASGQSQDFSWSAEFVMDGFRDDRF